MFGIVRQKIDKTVGAMFINVDKEVLLGLRSPSKIVRPGCWDLIGGHVHEGEGLEDALIREAREEVPVEPVQFRRIAIFREPQPERYGDALHHVYSVTSWRGGDPTNNSAEHTELRWFSIHELRLIKNIADHRYSVFAQLAFMDKTI
jgi:8-oxo-dGTP pyrophosphatase MutT (NUDIX family)